MQISEPITIPHQRMSKRIREPAEAEKAFSKLFGPLFLAGAALKVLDAGCGLGFLPYVVAKLFPMASVTALTDSGMAACPSFRWIRQWTI